MRRFIAVLIAALAVTGTAVAGFSAAGIVGGTSTRAAAETTINVSAYEYNFTLSAGTAPAGIVHFVVTNIGKDDHDFSIAGQKTPTLQPGQNATLTITLNAGTYNYACTIGEHASFGMVGTFTVTGQTTTAVTTITTGNTTIVSTQTTTATTTPPPATTVSVSEKEFKIILPSTKKRVAYYKRVNGKRVKRYRTVLVQKPLKAGRVHFVIKNIGKIAHNFVIPDAGGQSLVIGAGKSTTLDVDLTAGKHRFECSITGHAAAGMKGTLVAK